MKLIRSSASILAACAMVGVLVWSSLTISHCADDSLFIHDSGVPDGSSWPAVDKSEPTPDSYKNPCAPDPAPSVSGVVFAPNGIDPIAGAAVYVPVALKPIPEQVYCNTCIVTGKFRAHTYAAADGSFKLTNMPTGQIKIGIEKGQFRRIIDVDVPACGQITLTAEQTRLPGRNKQWGPWDAIPKIGVITGVWDRMEKVLDKLGVTEVTLFNGQDPGDGVDSVPYLMQNGALLKSHHMLLINCGTRFESLVTTIGPARENLLAYVREGGRVFATDLSYDFVEQVFPEFIDFEGSEQTPTNQPEEPNAAERGTGDIVVNGVVEVQELRDWLGLPEINAFEGPQSKAVRIEGFNATWAVQNSTNSALGTRVWVSGDVTWAGGKGPRPLTSSFVYRGADNQGCGRVAFSSYHTWGDKPALLPQERILEFMILEIGTCIELK